MSERMAGALDRPGDSFELQAYSYFAARIRPTAEGIAGVPGARRASPAEAAEFGAVVGHAEISRWPGREPALEYNYWKNHAAVRRRLAGGIDASLQSEGAFWRLLRELHVLSAVGEDFETYYLPASLRQWEAPQVPPPGTFRRPGAFFCRAEADFPAAYCLLLAQYYGDAHACPENFALFSSSGAAMGETRWTWKQRPDRVDARHTFEPPGALTPSVMTEVFAATRSAFQGTGEAAAEVASMVQRFAQVTPFPYGNFGLAMNVANLALARRRQAIAPHGCLDFVAQRLSDAAFRRHFAFAVSRNAASRIADQRAALVEMGRAGLTTVQAAREWLLAHADAAAVLIPGPLLPA